MNAFCLSIVSEQGRKFRRQGIFMKGIVGCLLGLLAATTQLRISVRNCLIALVFGMAPALANPLAVPAGTSLPIGGYSNSHHQEMVMCAAGQAIVSIAVGQGDFVRALWFHCEDVFGGGYTGDTLFEHRVGTD